MGNQIGLGLLILAVLLVGITPTCGLLPTLTPSSPVPPTHLLHLPAWARIQCPERESWRTGVTLWEHVERYPSEWGDTRGDRGTDLGVLENCESVEVVAYEWSFFGEEFWVMVDNHHGQRGWLAAKYVEFEP